MHHPCPISFIPTIACITYSVQIFPLSLTYSVILVNLLTYYYYCMIIIRLFQCSYSHEPMNYPFFVACIRNITLCLWSQTQGCFIGKGLHLPLQWSSRKRKCYCSAPGTSLLPLSTTWLETLTLASQWVSTLREREFHDMNNYWFSGFTFFR